FISGTILSLAISTGLERIERVYFFDLLGAAAGCLLLIPLLGQLGGPDTTLVAALLFAATAAIWHNMGGSNFGRVLSVALALAMLGLVFVNAYTGILDVRYAKGQQLGREFFVKWTDFSRIGVAPEYGSATIYIDADASTGIAN